MRIKQFANFPSIKTLKIAAISTLAIGAAVSISAAPAQAVVLTSGSLNFNDGSINTLGSIPGPFTAGFNGTNTAIVSVATGGFASLPTFSTLGGKTVAPDTVSFTASGSNYTSTDSFVADFGTAGKLTIATGSVFVSSPTVPAGGTSFQYTGVGTFTTTDNAVTPLNIALFRFDVDNTPSANGSYNIQATVAPSASVPEPFTIIGTIIGGTAAFRMKKKLSK